MRLHGNSPRLPIYLLVDTSASMFGAKIEAVNAGLQSFTAALRQDPQALECAAISVITFATDAKQLMPLTDAGSFSPPTLAAAGGTSFGDALRTLANAINRETRKRTTEYRGDWRPMTFLMTDAQPTDTDDSNHWRTGLAEYQRVAADWKCLLVAIGCGANADLQLLNEITNVVLRMPDMTPEVFASLFQWISQSVRTVSRAVGAPSALGQDAVAGQLPALPPGVILFSV